uniref:Uncharacterized protein n=1 Tax=Candidatus Kentrum sp. SD TaxID=2126332 RepID=A0A451BRV1_9GAMM|nr:MAG: hypothetical protein BECKSD772D_GA0070982_11922 [Candidatus Kentron sp. SD]
MGNGLGVLGLHLVSGADLIMDDPSQPRIAQALREGQCLLVKPVGQGEIPTLATQTSQETGCRDLCVCVPFLFGLGEGAEQHGFGLDPFALFQHSFSQVVQFLRRHAVQLGVVGGGGLLRLFAHGLLEKFHEPLVGDALQFRVRGAQLVEMGFEFGGGCAWGGFQVASRIVKGSDIIVSSKGENTCKLQQDR